MHIRTSHRIVPHGPDKMVLSDCATGAAIVTAYRVDGTSWRIEAAGADERTARHGEGRCTVPDHHSAGDHASTRCSVVNSMIHMADELSDAPGLSIFVPYRLDTNGATIHLRDEP